MTSTHLHLITTHLPIFGSIIGASLLAYGMWSKANPTKSAAYLLFIISAIGAGIAYFTGEAAEETVEHIPGISEHLIEQHEDFAVYALVSLIVLGAVSIASLITNLKRIAIAKILSRATLLLSLISFALAARTGYLGGQIRHTELNSTPLQNAMDNESPKQQNGQ